MHGARPLAVEEHDANGSLAKHSNNFHLYKSGKRGWHLRTSAPGTLSAVRIAAGAAAARGSQGHRRRRDCAPGMQTALCQGIMRTIMKIEDIACC